MLNLPANARPVKDRERFLLPSASYWIGCCMAKKREPVDELLDALVWMRRKARKHEAVDDLVDALVKMRRKARKKLAKGKGSKKKRGIGKQKRGTSKKRKSS
jgi:hypothetical protein